MNLHVKGRHLGGIPFDPKILQVILILVEME